MGNMLTSHETQQLLDIYFWVWIAQRELIISVTLHCISWFKMLAESKGGQLVLVGELSIVVVPFTFTFLPWWCLVGSRSRPRRAGSTRQWRAFFKSPTGLGHLCSEHWSSNGHLLLLRRVLRLARMLWGTYHHQNGDLTKLLKLVRK